MGEPARLNWAFSSLDELKGEVRREACGTPEGKEAVDYLNKTEEALMRLARRWRNEDGPKDA